MISVIRLLLFIIAFCFGLRETTNYSTLDAFVPKKEWQIVKPGQHIPPGLHVRQSLKTGLTEAKLLDPNVKSDSTYSTILVSSKVEENAESAKVEVEPLNGTLQLPYIQDDISDNYSKPIREFRSYQQLKADFEALHISMKTDLELLDELMDQLKTTVDNEQIQRLLEDLSYLLHQVDNGRYFADKDGFLLVLNFLHHPDLKIQKSSLIAVAAAVQGNSKVKIIALQNGILDAILMLLQASLSSKTTEMEMIKSACLTALGALLRDFPSVQKYFFTKSEDREARMSGSDLLSNLYHSEDTDGQNSLLTQMRIRIMTFIGDLIAERVNARLQSLNASSDDDLKLWRLYSEFPLEDILQQTGWCARLHRLMLNDLQPAVKETELNQPFNHAQREKILSSALYLFPICQHALTSDPNVDSILGGLEHEYFLRSRTRDNEYDFYFLDIYDLIVQVRGLLKKSGHSVDEL